MTRRRFITAVAAASLLLFSPSPAHAAVGTITAVVGSGVSSQPHLAGDGDWTFTVAATNGTISRLTVAVRLESCSGTVAGYHELRYRRSAPLTVGAQFTVTGIPVGLHCARASVEGATGAAVALQVSHPSSPAPGTVVILRPAQLEPLYVGSSSWSVAVAAAVVGTGDAYDEVKTNELRWYEYDGQAEVWNVLLPTPNGEVHLAVGNHELVASAADPSTGLPQAAYEVVVHPELDVVIGDVTIAGSVVTAPVSVSSAGVGTRSYLEGRVTAPDGTVRFTPTTSTDGAGEGTLTFKATKPGTYSMRVDAHADRSMYGSDETTFSK